MESSKMKNMVVIKNLPSNMVEEAIIIFKENQRIPQKEVINQSRTTNTEEVKTKSKEYILKEAEMLVTDYINKIEEKKNYTNQNTTNIIFKHKMLKLYSIVSTIILFIILSIHFI